VLDIGPRFFLVQSVSDLIWFNGFEALRLADVSSVTVPAPYASFVERALQVRKEHRSRAPRVKVSNLPLLIRTASERFPLLTIHREIVAPDVCHIGRVKSVDNRQLWLTEIGPDAKWDQEATRYRCSEITRVDFGGDYEQALLLVAADQSKTGRRRSRPAPMPAKPS
jgi:hypothetical protein